MNTTAKNILSLLAVLMTATVVSLILGCTVAALAHYRLGWDEVRANDVGNTVCTLAFCGTLFMGGPTRR